VNAKISVRSRRRTYSSEKKGLRRVINSLQWLATRTGPAASPAGHVQCFVKTKIGLDAADAQIQIMPMGFDRAFDADFDAISAVVSLCRPRSRGHLELRSADPLVAPRIFSQLLADPEDTRDLIRACEFARQVFATDPVRALVDREVEPGFDTQSVSQWRNWFERVAATNWHPAGTCAMGDSHSSVVDAHLRVHGIQGLRIADASIMPELPSGNTNAVVIAIAEKAADLIRDRACP
jgi:choline dehydrogenase